MILLSIRVNTETCQCGFVHSSVGHIKTRKPRPRRDASVYFGALKMVSPHSLVSSAPAGRPRPPAAHSSLVGSSCCNGLRSRSGSAAFSFFSFRGAGAVCGRFATSRRRMGGNDASVRARLPGDRETPTWWDGASQKVSMKNAALFVVRRSSESVVRRRFRCSDAPPPRRARAPPPPAPAGRPASSPGTAAPPLCWRCP